MHKSSPAAGGYARAAPINIFSGEGGLGGALTNPTELAKSKGGIKNSYPVVFSGRHWPDVETAYKRLKTSDATFNDQLMVELISAKFTQHPKLRVAVLERGGVAWLQTCSHMTNARSESSQSWEGVGLASRFIRDLIAGFELSFEEERSEVGQGMLF